MTQLVMEFPLPEGAVKIGADGMTVDLGNGVRMRTDIPPWVLGVKSSKLMLTIEIEGGPPDANTREAPVK